MTICPAPVHGTTCYVSPSSLGMALLQVFFPVLSGWGLEAGGLGAEPPRTLGNRIASGAGG